MKNIKILVGAVALFALVAVNVWNARTVFKASVLDITNVETVADGEPGEVLGRKNKYRESEYICHKKIIRYYFADGTVASGSNISVWALINAHGTILKQEEAEFTYPAINCPAGNDNCIAIEC